MDSNYFAELMKETFEAFIAQKPDNTDFDVVFVIDGKKLYAHKRQLIPFSSTLNLMLSERSTKSNEPIKIQDYNFNDFKEFVTFLYSGKCRLTEGNIFEMVEIAESFKVKALKKACGDFLKTAWDENNVNQILQLAKRHDMMDVIKSADKFLLRTSKLDLSNIYQMLELAYQYSLKNFKKSLLEFVSKNLSNFIKSKQFQNLHNSIIYDVVRTNEKAAKQEELFEKVCIWAERRALGARIEDQNKRIKAELAPVLPFFKFQLMKNEFLIDFLFLVKKSFLFSGDELRDIFCGARYTVCLKDKNGKMMKGVLDCLEKDRISEIFRSQKNVVSKFKQGKRNVWKILQSTDPIISSRLIKRDGIEWYLVYWYDVPTPVTPFFFLTATYKKTDIYYFLGVKHRSEIKDNDNLLVEMIAEDGFEIDNSEFV